MIGRRELFRRAVGAGVAAATVKPSDLIAAASKGGVGLGAVVGQVGSEVDMPSGSYSNSVWQLFDDVHAEIGFSRSEARYMDPDIRDKVSWSPAFKSIVHSQREREMYALRRKMQDDQNFANKVKKLLGGAK